MKTGACRLTGCSPTITLSKLKRGLIRRRIHCAAFLLGAKRFSGNRNRKTVRNVFIIKNLSLQFRKNMILFARVFLFILIINKKYILQDFLALMCVRCLNGIRYSGCQNEFSLQNDKRHCNVAGLFHLSGCCRSAYALGQLYGLQSGFF